MSNPTPTPAGWYDDSTGTKPERYWDGTQWTEQLRPAPAAAPVGVAVADQAQTPAGAGVPVVPAYGAPVTPAEPKQRNVLGIVALAVAVVGFIFACLPGALIIGWVLLPI